MDRVFEPVRPVDAITPPITPQRESLDRRPVWRSKAVLGVVLISSTAISLVALTALLMWRQWMETRQQLRQERQLQLLERLQPLPQHQLTPTRTTPPAPPTPSAPLPPIRVDVPEMFPAIAPPPPARVQEGQSGANEAAAMPQKLPELLGVVRVPGNAGSAIFRTGAGSVSTAVGEAIGASGWRLEEVTRDQVEIERDGTRQRLSLGGR